jgi:hypothetical protein
MILSGGVGYADSFKLRPEAFVYGSAQLLNPIRHRLFAAQHLNRRDERTAQLVLEWD